jgi:hypothetical protein
VENQIAHRVSSSRSLVRRESQALRDHADGTYQPTKPFYYWNSNSLLNEILFIFGAMKRNSVKQSLNLKIQLLFLENNILLEAFLYSLNFQGIFCGFLKSDCIANCLWMVNKDFGHLEILLGKRSVSNQYYNVHQFIDKILLTFE